MNVTVAKVSAWITLAVNGVEPYMAKVITASYAETERLFLPSGAEVSYTTTQGEISWPSVVVRGRSPRRGSTDNYASGANVFIRYDAEDESDILTWPAYVQEIFIQAREVVEPL